jgi:hypothetical protein
MLQQIISADRQTDRQAYRRQEDSRQEDRQQDDRKHEDRQQENRRQADRRQEDSRKEDKATGRQDKKTKFEKKDDFLPKNVR